MHIDAGEETCSYFGEKQIMVKT